MKSFHLAEFFSFDIAPYCSTAKFESGQSILEEGSGSVSLYFLSEGRAKLFLTHENGRTSLVSFLDAPCFIGEMEFLGAQQCTNGVTAITPCTCYRIDTAACHEQIMNDAKFLRQLCLFLSKKSAAQYSSIFKKPGLSPGKSFGRLYFHCCHWRRLPREAYGGGRISRRLLSPSALCVSRFRQKRDFDEKQERILDNRFPSFARSCR